MEQKYFEVIKGEDKDIPLKIIDSVTRDPIDLTNRTISGVLKGCPENVEIDDTYFEVVNPVLGKIVMKLTDVETLLLKEGVQSFEVILDDGDDRKIVQFINQLEVKRRI
jgi:hypothetical protein